MQYSNASPRFGAIGYDGLIILNTLVNAISRFFGRGKVSLSKTIKDNIKTSLKYVNNFEETLPGWQSKKDMMPSYADTFITRRFGIFNLVNQKSLYLNSGDWIENLTAIGI